MPNEHSFVCDDAFYDRLKELQRKLGRATPEQVVKDAVATLEKVVGEYEKGNDSLGARNRSKQELKQHELVLLKFEKKDDEPERAPE